MLVRRLRVAFGATLVLASAAYALPAGVKTLHGTAAKLPATVTYAASAKTLNGFSVDYTCHGKKPVNDADVYTIVDGGDDSVALATVSSAGHIKASLKGHISRFSEDGPKAIGSGRLSVDLKVSTTATKRRLRGTARVHSGTCPSVKLKLRVSAAR
ncbi:MAG: hypothetical protein QOG15_3507 [Solirubrobacteraceae bacterium]|nr:hypothetical protein [Solirubrobacteraceae bacterium]